MGPNKRMAPEHSRCDAHQSAPVLRKAACNVPRLSPKGQSLLARLLLLVACRHSTVAVLADRAEAKTAFPPVTRPRPRPRPRPRCRRRHRDPSTEHDHQVRHRTTAFLRCCPPVRATRLATFTSSVSSRRNASTAASNRLLAPCLPPSSIHAAPLLVPQSRRHVRNAI